MVLHRPIECTRLIGHLVRSFKECIGDLSLTESVGFWIDIPIGCADECSRVLGTQRRLVMNSSLSVSRLPPSHSASDAFRRVLAPYLVEVRRLLRAAALRAETSTHIEDSA